MTASRRCSAADRGSCRNANTRRRSPSLLCYVTVGCPRISPASSSDLGCHAGHSEFDLRSRCSDAEDVLSEVCIHIPDAQSLQSVRKMCTNIGPWLISSNWSPIGSPTHPKLKYGRRLISSTSGAGMRWIRRFSAWFTRANCAGSTVGCTTPRGSIA